MNVREIVQIAKRTIKESVDDLHSQEWEYNKLERRWERAIFIGTVFTLTPSGKYYTPFACSNIDPCPKCDGYGSKQDKKETCVYCNGTGKQTVEKYMSSGLGKVGDIFECMVCNGTGYTHPSCSYCQGIGSREAYEDKVFQEALSEEASRYDAYIFSGDGDPCDIFLGEYKWEEE